MYIILFVIVILCAKILPSDQCLSGEDLHGPPPYIIFHISNVGQQGPEQEMGMWMWKCASVAGVSTTPQDHLSAHRIGRGRHTRKNRIHKELQNA